MPGLVGFMERGTSFRDNARVPLKDCEPGRWIYAAVLEQFEQVGDLFSTESRAGEVGG